MIPNFIDTDRIRPAERENAYRREFGLEAKTVVMYAGNVGWSQSLDLVLAAAGHLAHDPDVAFVINGGGVAYGVGFYAQDLNGRNGIPAREDRTRHELSGE